MQEKGKRSNNRKDSVFQKKNKGSDKRRHNRGGPRLAPSLQREVNQMKGDDNEVSDFDEGDTFAGDVYEYEEAVPEEESRKNRRYDTVDNYDYKLPDDFKVRVIILVDCLFFFNFCYVSLKFGSRYTLN